MLPKKNYELQSELSEVLNYEIRSIHGFPAVNKKYFELADLNFDDYGETSVDEDGQRPETGTWLEEEQLSDGWKRAIHCERFDF